VFRTPFAAGLVTVLFVTTLWLRDQPDHADEVLRWVSTNVHNLSVAPIRSVVLSAFFLPDGRWLSNAILLVVVLAPLEWRFGTRWAIAVFASAHVLATMVTEAWEFLAIRDGDLPAQARYEYDVGVSYGLYGAAAAACYLLPRPLRPFGVLLVVCYVGIPFVLSSGMTTSGHVLAVSTGLAWFPVFKRLSVRPLPWRT
jgi:hypothetical protein